MPQNFDLPRTHSTFGTEYPNIIIIMLNDPAEWNEVCPDELSIIDLDNVNVVDIMWFEIRCGRHLNPQGISTCSPVTIFSLSENLTLSQSQLTERIERMERMYQERVAFCAICGETHENFSVEALMNYDFEDVNSARGIINLNVRRTPARLHQ